MPLLSCVLWAHYLFFPLLPRLYHRDNSCFVGALKEQREWAWGAYSRYSINANHCKSTCPLNDQGQKKTVFPFYTQMSMEHTPVYGTSLCWKLAWPPANSGCLAGAWVSRVLWSQGGPWHWHLGTAEAWRRCHSGCGCAHAHHPQQQEEPQIFCLPGSPGSQNVRAEASAQRGCPERG